MSNSDNVCVVCFKNVSIYSIGCCDHRVCFECSTRMRVLCRQNECPICRQDMQLVVFTKDIKPFAEIHKTTRLIDKKYNIAFESAGIQDAFYKLLEHACPKCRNRTFGTFQQLSDHMKKTHDLFYCDLCVENLKILTSERKCYSKADLAQHRRKGDVDDKSHKGHPLCEFCNTRYMDNDDLYRHLRKEHLYCHFCDADGLHMYYSSYDYLRDHFRQEHYLCEEGECIDEKFTPVFRTEIDLRAHRVSEHGRSIGKMAAKQARTLEVEFTLKPRNTRADARRREERETLFGDSGRVDPSSMQSSHAEARREPTPPPLNPNDFPTLGDGSSSVPLTNIAPPRGASAYTIRTVGRSGPNYDQHFPGLPQGEVAAAPTTSVRFDFNSERKPSAQPNVSIHVNHRPGRNNIRVTQEAFPALSSKPGKSSSNLNWIAVGKNLGQTPTTNQQPSGITKWSGSSKKTPNPAPPIATAQVSSKPREEDFPTLNSKFSANLNLQNSEPPKANYVNLKSNLSKEGKKASSVTIPVEKSWPAPDSPQQTKAKTKKKKKGGDDTAKKKSEPVKEIASASIDSNAPPLPTAADWFGSSDKHDDVDDDEPDSSEISHMVESVLQLSRQMNKPKGPPPGFASVNGVKPAPPPGFTPTTSNGLTFTNSSGEMFSIGPSAPYLPPPDFDERNIQLVNKVNEILLNDSSLEDFRWMSAAFRRNELSGEEYLVHCQQAMGNEGMKVLLPELLVLLPDITKQQELYEALQRRGIAQTGKKRLEKCKACSQVVMSSELKQHHAAHVLDSNSNR